MLREKIDLREKICRNWEGKHVGGKYVVSDTEIDVESFNLVESILLFNFWRWTFDRKNDIL